MDLLPIIYLNLYYYSPPVIWLKNCLLYLVFVFQQWVVEYSMIWLRNFGFPQTLRDTHHDNFSRDLLSWHFY